MLQLAARSHCLQLLLTSQDFINEDMCKLKLLLTW